MRIIVTSHYGVMVGGVETYIERLLELLVAAGHEVIVVFETVPEPGQRRVSVPAGVPIHYVQSAGLESVVQALNALEDSVVLANSLDSTLYTGVRRIRHPIAFYAHAYIGSCITGMRVNRLPTPRPCERDFGPACLIHYFPRRCGGLNPLTMIRSYRQQVEWRQSFPLVDFVIANSDAVARQFSTAGVSARTLHPVLDAVVGVPRTKFRRADSRSLVFVGRFADYKGGRQLLDALPSVALLLGMPIRLTMVGEGSQQSAWEKHAATISARDSRISVTFTGWLSSEAVADVVEDHDLIVVPSVWPEPFGLVGLEAARFGVPSAGFAVGGIPEWLEDGVSGHLADGSTCSPEDLGAAVARCLADVEHYRKLSAGAVERLATYSPEAHVQQLEELLRLTVESRAAPGT